MSWRHHNDTLSWVDSAVYLRDLCFLWLFSRTVRLQKYKWLPKKVWDKSKTTWAVGIAQLTHHEVQGGGKNPETAGRGIFAPHRGLNLGSSQIQDSNQNMIIFLKCFQQFSMSGFYTKGRPLVKSNLIRPSDTLSWQPGCPVLNINIQGNFCISQGNGSSDNLLENLG